VCVVSSLFICRTIQPKELLNQSWNDHKKTGKKSNVNHMIDSFNNVSKWVATEVVTGATDKKRAEIIRFFISVGQHCYKLQNFNALMAIVAGLNGSAIHRLKKSWDLVPPKSRAKFEELQTTMSQQNNYATLRNLLHSVDPPCIPYLGMYLTDLTFIEDGNKDEVDGLINFDKRRKISFVIREVQQYQLANYNLNDVGLFPASSPFQGFKPSFALSLSLSLRIKTFRRSSWSDCNTFSTTTLSTRGACRPSPGHRPLKCFLLFFFFPALFPVFYWFSVQQDQPPNFPFSKTEETKKKGNEK